MQETVKSRASGQTRRHAGWLAAVRGRAALVCCLFLPLLAAPEARGEAPPTRPGTQKLEQGTARAASRVIARRRCSLTKPVCVETNEPTFAEPALRLLVDAYETTILGNQGPSWSLDPLGEPMLWQIEAGPLRTRISRAPSVGFDRGRATCVGGELTRATAMACAARSSLALAAPGTAPALESGIGAYVAGLYDGGQQSVSAKERRQREPERGLLSDVDPPLSLDLFEQVALRAGAGRSLTAPWAGLVLAATKTTAGAPRASAEPDFFDVLRSTLGGEDPHLALFFDQLATLGFAMGAGTPGASPEVAWDIDAASLPRNLVLPKPLLPTGSTYLLVSLDDRTRSAGLALRTFCETGSRYVWSMARLDEQGRIQTRVEVPRRESSPNAEGVLRELDAAHRALIVGTSLGGTPGQPLDPDDAPFPPHSCEVALDRLPDL